MVLLQVGQENQLCPLDEKYFLVLFQDKNQLGTTYLPWETFAVFFFSFFFPFFRVAVLEDEGCGRWGWGEGRGGALSCDFSTRLASVSCNAGQSQRTEKKQFKKWEKWGYKTNTTQIFSSTRTHQLLNFFLGPFPFLTVRSLVRSLILSFFLSFFHSFCKEKVLRVRPNSSSRSLALHCGF